MFLGSKPILKWKQFCGNKMWVYIVYIMYNTIYLLIYIKLLHYHHTLVSSNAFTLDWTLTMIMNNHRCMQGRTIYQDKNGGIIISGNSLAVQNIERQHEGNYSCLATNDVGSIESQPIHLDIKCKLFNLQGHAKIYIYRVSQKNNPKI